MDDGKDEGKEIFYLELRGGSQDKCQFAHTVNLIAKVVKSELHIHETFREDYRKIFETAG